MSTTIASAQQCSDLACALASRIPYLSAVGGRPITHLAETLEARARHFEWAINEKCAAETAVGLSAVGARSAVVLKHNGLSFALDSLLNAGVHSIGAGMLLVVGDDPNALSSTSIQDSRMLAKFANLPLLEPALDGDADSAVGLALSLSEQHRTPVIVRVTQALHRGCRTDAGSNRIDSPVSVPTEPFAGPGQQGDRSVAHGLTKLGRFQRQRLTTVPHSRRAFGDHLVEACCRPSCSDSVVAVGAVARRVDEAVGQEVCTLSVRAGWPVPSEVVAFADRHPSVLVAEDSAPFLEGFLLRHAASRSAVRGRLSGHLPPDGALSVDDVRRAGAGPYPGAWQTAERKSDVPPALGRYDTLFRAIGLLHAEGTFVATDVGSSVRLCYPPYSGADVALSLGSAAAVAGGAARTGRRAIAVMGDYALLHSGLEPLLETVRHGLPTLTVVLDNGVQAQTGGQPVPNVPLLPLIESCGVTATDSWAVDELSVQATTRRLVDLLHGPLPAVALVSTGKREHV
ncbi:thiamine pyrophosphate-dependent enzyme [Streptomyces sp. NPDC059980]|uniref:thiamine pyrophosphate-dependent enzyme n=1 Tax=Streptomyces sp. NPDC059980 TaxID=3347022 RepID=UPI0036789DA6